MKYGQVDSAQAATIVEEISAREFTQDLEAKRFIIGGAPEILLSGVIATPRATWPFGISGIALIIGLIFIITVGLLTQSIHVFGGLIVTELSMLVAALLPVIWWMSRKETDVEPVLHSQRSARWVTRIVEELGLRPERGLENIVTDLLIGVAVGLFTLFATIPITILWRWLLPPPQIYLDIMSQSLTPVSLTDLIFWILLMIFVVGFCEEVFARGVIQQGAENHYSRWGGLVLGAFLFAFIHIDPFRFAPLFFMSLIWGYMFQVRGWSLYVPWAAHATNNIIALVLLYFAPFFGV
ncbi:MAG: lysostaphin resistance A-like protein [Promethearchaeota archaeon]